MSADLEILSVAQRLKEGDMTEETRKKLAGRLQKAVALIRESARRLASYPDGGKA